MYHTETAQKNGKCYQTCARKRLLTASAFPIKRRAILIRGVSIAPSVWSWERGCQFKFERLVLFHVTAKGWISYTQNQYYTKRKIKNKNLSLEIKQ